METWQFFKNVWHILSPQERIVIESNWLLFLGFLHKSVGRFWNGGHLLFLNPHPDLLSRVIRVEHAGCLPRMLHQGGAWLSCTAYSSPQKWRDQGSISIGEEMRAQSHQCIFLLGDITVSNDIVISLPQVLGPLPFTDWWTIFFRYAGWGESKYRRFPFG